MKTFTKTDVARKYRDEHGMEMPTLKLARIMHKETNPLFKDVESARRTLREIEGKVGRGDKTKVFDRHKIPDRPKNPYKLPESDEISFEPFVIKGHKRVAIYLSYTSIV